MTDQELKDLVASFAEDRKEMKLLIDQMARETEARAEARQKEAEARQKEAEAAREKEAASAREKAATAEREIKEIRQSLKEASDFQKEADRIVKEVSKQMGGINDNIGFHAEQFFQNVFKEKLEFGRIKYDEMIPNLTHKGKKDEIEFDIALVNGDSIALIEVKNRIHPDFVIKLAEERIEKFREYFHEFDNYDVYLGIAGFSFSDEVLDRASTYGIGIVRQVGEGVEIEANNLKVY